VQSAGKLYRYLVRRNGIRHSASRQYRRIDAEKSKRDHEDRGGSLHAEVQVYVCGYAVRLLKPASQIFSSVDHGASYVSGRSVSWASFDSVFRVAGRGLREFEDSHSLQTRTTTQNHQGKIPERVTFKRESIETRCEICSMTSCPFETI
jgi:hypothetical protein